MSEGKDRLLAQMKDAEGAVYVLISGFTKEPYVECDKETYDDKVFVYMEEEAAKAKAGGTEGREDSGWSSKDSFRPYAVVLYQPLYYGSQCTGNPL